MENFKAVKISKERQLSYLEYGAENGKPVLYFHGWPGFRMETELIEPEAKKFGLRIIAVDRPGYRGSTYVEERKISDFAYDIKIFMEEMRLEKPHLIGASGGGPYALACAYRTPDLFDKIIVVSGLPELKRLTKKEESAYVKLFLRYGAKNPAIIKYFFKLFFWEIKKFPDLTIKMAKKMNKTDLNKQEYSDQLAELFIRKYSEINDTNLEALIKDALLYTEEWDFDVEKIKKEITFWHGTNDKICPLKGAEKMFELFENKKVNIVEAGHFLIAKEQENIFSYLCTS